MSSSIFLYCDYDEFEKKSYANAINYFFCVVARYQKKSAERFSLCALINALYV
jgi:outer membrane protein assembly factor BamD (BamD/ComL family)